MNDIENEVTDILEEYFPAGLPPSNMVEAALPIAQSLEETVGCGVESHRSP